MADFYEAKYSFSKMVAETRRIQEEMAQIAAEVRASGDETLAAAVEYNKQLATSAKAIPKAVPSAVTAPPEIEKANRLRQQAVELDKADAEALSQQTRVLTEQVAIRERLQTQQGSLIVPQGPRYGPWEQTAGGMAAAEAAARREAALAGLGTGIDQQLLAATRSGSLYTATAGTKDYSQLAGGQAAAERQERERTLAVEREQVRAEQERLAIEREQTAQLIEQHQQLAYSTGAMAGAAGGVVPAADRYALAAGPQGIATGAWTAADAAAARYNTTLGTYDAQIARAGQSTDVMTAQLTRLGMADAEASNQMRKHGALTTEFLGALARGETTVSELGYQVGATIGKFAGWTAAATATYGALGAVVEFGKGALDAATSVQQLTRTIDNLDPNKASTAIQGVSQATNVSMKEAGDAVFAFSRTFHNLSEASGAAHLGLAALKLDNVAITDSVRASTAITQQYGGGLSTLTNVYNMLSAAQREYNARISDMIPLLQKSSGAVHNAGGDLSQLIQIGAYAARITQQGGAQIGTGLYRSASNYLSQATPQGQGNRDALKMLGIDVTGSYTQTLINAIRRAQETGPSALTPTQRGQLSIDVFGKQYGGRFSALFNPSGTDTFNRITGSGPGGINAAQTRGSLQLELSRELGTAKQQLEGFLYSMQRVGAAFANTGAINLFIAGIHVAASALNEVGSLLNTFGSLPGPLKEAAVAAVGLRTAMLFFSRTRLGSTTPGITRIPGFRPSEATLNRGQLAIGTRQAIGVVEQDLSQTQALNTQLKARAVIIANQRDALDKEINALDKEGNASQEQDAALKERRIALQAKIGALDAEIGANEEKAIAQGELLAALKEQRVGLTSSRGNPNRYGDTRVNAMAAGVSEETYVADTAAREANATAVRLDTAALEVNTEVEISRLSRITSGVGTMVAALDPWLLAMVALPFVIGEVTSAISAQNDAEKQLRQTLSAHPSSITDFASQGARLRGAAGPSAPVNSVANALGYGAIEGLFGRGEAGTVQINGRTFNPNDLGRQIGQITQVESDMVKHFTEYTKGLASKPGGGEQISHISARMKAYIAQVARRIVPNLPSIQREANQTFADALQAAYNGAIQGSPIRNESPFASFSSLSAKQLEQQVQYADDASKVFGTQNGDSLKQAAYGYTYLANKYSHGASDANLQAVATAQQNFISTVTKSVQDMLHAAQSATSLGGQERDVSSALGVIEHARQVEEAALAAIIKEDKGNADAIRKAKEAADQVFAQLNDQLKSVLDAQTQIIQTQTALQQSQVTGSSPESDIQRARLAVAGDQAVVDKLRAGGANWQDVAKAQATLNDAQNALDKSLKDNANNIGDAADKLAISRVTGISPADDILRARLTVTEMADKLARDQSSGAGQAAILNDQAALFDAERALNQAVQQRSQQEAQNADALLKAQTALQQSQTLDPIKKASEQLASDIQALTLIKPQDYTDPKQYQAALLQARAKINNDRTSLNDQIVQTDLSTAQFELTTNKIGDQQYINILERILRTKRLTLQQKQQIESEIYRVQQGLAGNLDLNVGNIKLPSVYEIKRAIGLGQRGQLPGGTNTIVNHTSNVTVNVYGAKGAAAVGHVLDAHLNTSISAMMRAKGAV